MPRPLRGKNAGSAVAVGAWSTRDPKETVWGSPDHTSLNLTVSPGCTCTSLGKYCSAASGITPLTASTETEKVWGPAGAGAGCDGGTSDGFGDVHPTPEPAARNTIRTSVRCLRSLRIAGDLVRSMHTPSAPRAADQADQEHGGQHRQDEAAGTVEDEEPHEEADEGPGETQQDRHADAE